MTKEQEQVKDFMSRIGQECPAQPTIPTDSVQYLRLDLIDEELKELNLAFHHLDLVEVADAIGDLLYVVLGTAVACGIDIDPVFQEIHKSNLSKFLDGFSDLNGKWRKGKSYIAPDLKPIIEKQSQ